MMKFDKEIIAEHFIDNLKNKYLLPKPHLCVLNTKYPENERKGIFTVSDRPASNNLIGYDISVKELNKDAVTKTILEFWVRNGTIKSSKEATDDDFIPIKAEMSTELLSEKTTLTIINNRNGDVLLKKQMELTKQDNKLFFKDSWESEFDVDYKKIGKDKIEKTKNKLKILFKKNIKKEKDIFRVQVRISNENYDNKIKDIGCLTEDSERLNQSSLSILLDFKISEFCEDAVFYKENNRWGSNTSVKRIYNIVPQDENNNTLVFSEYYKGYETIPKFKVGKRKDEFVLDLQKEGLELHQSIVNAFKFPSFYNYQEEGISNILREMKERRGQINIIQVRTAGGKTETFTVPLLEYCIQNKDKKGVKGLIFYPTKALANDQASRIFKALYYLNRNLNDRKITMGLYHGDVKKSFDEDKEIWIPFKCPKCEDEGKDIPLSFIQKGISNLAFCPNCKEEFKFLILTRYEIHKELPDIVITNQDTLHLTMMNKPERHSIFGRRIEYCNKCGVSFINKKECSICHNELEHIIPETSPDIIILDEIHMLGGAFGINTALFIKRIENLIRNYSKEREKYSPVYIAATATIKNPKDFVAQVFNNDNVRMIPKSSQDAYDIVGSDHKRLHIFILPKAFDSADTLAYGVSFILGYFENQNIEDKPRILGFCQSIKDNRNLIKLTRIRSPKGKNFQINGHTSQFEKNSRAEIEKKFTRREIDVLFATSTLEVGVDFDDVNILLLHGVPYSFNDFLQRVGRSGRKEKDALVITTLRKWSSLDYFYFERSRDMLHNSEKFIVDPPFNKNNEVILKNHIRAAFFDYLSSLKNTDKIVKISDLKKFLFVGSEYSDSLLEDIKKYMSFFYLEEHQKNLINEILSEIKTEMLKPLEMQNIYDLFDSFDTKYQIGRLRTSDKVVEVEFSI